MPAKTCEGSLSLVLLLTGCGIGTSTNEYKPPPPPEVTVAKPLQQSVTEFVEENGETEVVQRVEVRARVQGFLEEIRFDDGAAVEAGDVLYVIEPDQYEADVASAQAALTAAEAAIQVAKARVSVATAEVTRAEFEFKRQEALFAREAATQSQLDEALASRDSAVAGREAAVADVAASEAERDRATANLERAKLDLKYTVVEAPISGWVTKTEIKTGNLVDIGDLLCAVVDRSQIYANFNVSDRTLVKLQTAIREHRDVESLDDQWYRQFRVYLKRESDDGYPFVGHFDYVDQEGVDQATGTFAMRAIFDNQSNLLLPGLFVRVRFAVPFAEEKASLLVPEQAIARDQQGTFVLAADSSDSVVRRNVDRGPIFDGMVVIEKGLDPDDRVLLDGTQRARPGSQVTPTETELSPVSTMSADGEISSPPTTDESRSDSSASESSRPAEGQGATSDDAVEQERSTSSR